MSAAVTPVFFIGGRQSDAGLTPDIVGSKAANLGRLGSLGLRIPPAIAVGTSVCRDVLERGTLSGAARAAIAAGLRQLEQATGLTMGQRDPLLVSVRSSPPVSMPGMLDTILNVGLTPAGVHGLIRRTGNPWLAWDSLRRLICSFAETVHGLDRQPFDRLAASQLDAAGARTLQELDAISLRTLTQDTASLFQALTGAPLSVEPADQIASAVEAVVKSWMSPRAREYRRINALGESSGTGVLVQAMVFGNAGGRSGAGVGFTRNPSTGADELYVDFLFNAQGDDVVSGRRPIREGSLLPEVLPTVWSELLAARCALEREFLDMQDFEFTVNDGRLFLLQTRSGKRTSWAALQIAIDLVDSGVIDPATALERLRPYDLDGIQRVTVRGAGSETIVATATPAGAGVAVGALAFDAERARQLTAQGPVVLARTDLATEDISGLSVTAGIVTTFGGRTSHAAVVARQLEKVCLVGCQDLDVDERARRCTFGGRLFREGEVITLDGETGNVHAGAVPVVRDRPLEALARVEVWRRALAGNDQSLCSV
jgi:pyruvate,orthophosphate dikinase